MSSNDLFRFSIEGSLVVAIEEFDDGRWKNEGIDSDETYSINGNTIVKTEFEDGRQEITTYSDLDADGIYTESSKYYLDSTEQIFAEDDDESEENHLVSSEYNDSDESRDDLDNAGYTTKSNLESNDSDDSIIIEALSNEYQNNKDGYHILFDDAGNFVSLFEYNHFGELEDETEADSKYTFVDGVLYETELKSHGVEISLYADLDSDGVYTKVSSEYKASSDTSLSDFGYADALSIYGSDEDDWILLSNAVKSKGGAGSDSFVMRDLSNATINDFNAIEGDQIVFDTGYGLESIEELAQFISDISYNANTQTLSIDFNGLASIEIIGIADHEISWDIVNVLS
ncbi:hypothetical protein [Marinomonas ostreistagni]|uniref:Uncharacterized protein n=1 Tax=Marinomonas ostreistagni TaxID=359209 RepID=A0ABS0ZCU0_9GAMM|nr:hypothetical protein [Marinomonas ostreistagni]MBJ7551471.1 hypothetical protein [Marinomonas ostreistagni]